MQLDIRTLMLMVVAISFTLSIVMTYILRTTKTYPGFGLWAAGNGAFAIGFLLVALRGIIPDILSIVISNGLLLFCSILYVEGIHLFLGKPFSKIVIVFPVVLILALQSYFTFVNNDIEVRIITASIFYAVFFGMASLALFRNTQSDLRMSFWFAGGSFGLMSLFMIFRALVTYLFPGSQDLFSPSFLQVSTFIIAGILGIAWTFGLININSKRLESDLKTAQEEATRLFESTEKSRKELLVAVDERKLAAKMTNIRLNLFEYSVNHSLDELLQKTLDEVCELTNSPIGFYHFVESDQKTLTLQAWSTRTVKEFCKAEGKGMHYGIDKAGVWVDCVHERKPVIHNDYASLPNRKGMPEGHAVVIRELVVPIMRSGKIMAILGIGNKSENYTEKDIEIVSYLADIAWVIAEHKLTEKVIREKAYEFKTIIESTADGLLVVDRRGKVLHANSRFSEIWRIPGDFIVSGNDRALIDSALDQLIDPENFIAKVKDLYLSDRNDLDTLYFKDGRVIERFSCPLINEGKILGRIWSFRDITERKQAEVLMREAHEERRLMLEAAEKSRRVLLSVVEDQKLAEEEIRKLNAELEQRVADRTALLETANKELEAFSYSVSHDLRSPLQHLTGYTQLLNKRAAEYLDEKNKHYLKVIVDSAIRMGRLIDDLLAFSRMGRAEMMKRKTNLDSLVKEILRDFQEDSRSKNIDWKVSPLPEVYGDSAMLRQVLINLISNAFKFTKMQTDAVIEIGSTCGEKGEVCVYVKDNGAGFDMKYVDKLFGVFQRLHRADEFEGTGIGLANVRRIIHRHGGRVWAEGKEGEGATFYFTVTSNQ